MSPVSNKVKEIKHGGGGMTEGFFGLVVSKGLWGELRNRKYCSKQRRTSCSHGFLWEKVVLGKLNDSK